MKSYLENKTIFITGGTGSFGKEFGNEWLTNHKTWAHTKTRQQKG